MAGRRKTRHRTLRLLEAIEQLDQALAQVMLLPPGKERDKLELRAVTGLARLLVDRGDGVRAREVLVPMYDWLTGGLDKRDVVEAKAVLDGLG